MTLSSHGFAVESRGLSAEQLTRVQHLKRLLLQAGLFDEKRFDDHDLARFLKARNFDLQNAKQMWEAMLGWRREQRVDTINEWFVFHERVEYERVFPTGLHKTDKEGHPVLIQQLGRVNIGALYKVTTDERIRMAHIAENEHMRRAVFPACSHRVGRPVDRLFTIIDLEGIAFTSMMRTTSILKMYMQMDSNNYPETLARMAIINAPGWFSTSWSAIKGVLNGETVKKIEILGKDYQAALLRHIPRENLLAEYGGTSRGGLTENIGPWQEPLPLPPAAAPEPTPERPATPPPVVADGGVADDTAMRAEALDGVGALGGSLDQIRNRSASPVRPGAVKVGGGAATAALGAGGGMEHPAPALPGSPPLAKRPHLLDPQPQQQHTQQQHMQLVPHGHPQQQQQHTQQQGQFGQSHPGSSPAPSVSDSSETGTHNMSAPLLSNFLQASDSTTSPLQSAASAGGGGGGGGGAAGPLRSGSPPLASGGVGSGSMGRRRSSNGGATGGGGGGGGGIVSGLVAGLQAAASHIVAGYHHSHAPATHVALPGGPADGGVLHPLPANLGSPVGPDAPSPQPLQQRSGFHTPPGQQQHLASAAGAAGGASRGGGAATGVGAGPPQLQLTSPREDSDVLMSATSALHSMHSAMSPEPHSVADTASSRPTDGGAGGSGGGALLGRMASFSASAGTTGGGRAFASAGPTGGSSAGPTGGGASGMLGCASGTLNLSMFGSGVTAASGEFMSSATSMLPAGAAPQHPGLQPQGTGGDFDDAESVRMSVMSQRSFYSAMSHLDASSSSGITSPNSASEQTRRWSMQRELHAAAIASALAATSERRAAAAAAAAAAGVPTSGAASFTAAGAAGRNGGGTAGLVGVPYVVPPAAQQAFGSYLDQPPPYNTLGGGRGGGSGLHTPGMASNLGGGADAADRQAGSGGGGLDHAAGGGGGRAAQGHHVRSGSRGDLAGLAAGGGGLANGDAVIHIIGGPGGMSRSTSAATLTPDECSLGVGAGAVRWARGWFTRRRNYGRLIEADANIDGGVGGGAGGLEGGSGGRPLGASHGRKGSTGGPYNMLDGPGGTSPSKVMPKGSNGGGVHHSRGGSWDDQALYDQSYGRSVGGGSGGGIMRDLSFGRSSERRRLLSSDALNAGARKRGVVAQLEECCSCLPCCTIM